MSLNRENVTWQRPDGTWVIGFWDFHFLREEDPDFDYEWDVEYTDSFMWAATNNRTPEDAMQRYTRTHANPGGTWLVEHAPENYARIHELEETLLRYEAQERERVRLYR